MLRGPSWSWLLSKSQVLRRPLLPPQPTMRQPGARRVLLQARQGMQQRRANDVLPIGNHVLQGSFDPRRTGQLLQARRGVRLLPRYVLQEEVRPGLLPTRRAMHQRRVQRLSVRTDGVRPQHLLSTRPEMLSCATPTDPGGCCSNPSAVCCISPDDHRTGFCGQPNWTHCSSGVCCIAGEICCGTFANGVELCGKPDRTGC